MWFGRAEIGGKGCERPTTDIRKGSFLAVKEDRDPQFVGDPPGGRIAGENCIIECRRGQRYERDDVDDANPRVDPGMRSQIKSPDCSPDDCLRRSRTDHGEHRSVVIRIAVHVKKITACTERDLFHEIKVPTLADVDDALNHD